MGPSLVGKVLGSYEILSLIGQGGMGEVYAAKDTRLDRTVALKILPPNMADVPDRRARFEREAKAVAALNHPNIVTLHSVEEADGLNFITMELVEGRPLGRLVPDHGLSPGRLFELAIPIVDAVAAAHRKGIAHRDLKPDNVMVTEEGRVKVLDFGLAKLLDPTDPGQPKEEISPDTGTLSSPVTEEGRVLGTIAYMSPEQAEGKQADHRSDIFSLGVLLYAISTGRRPFTGSSNAAITAAILRDTPKPVHEVNTDLPREFGRVVRRCMEKDPNRRFQGADDLRLELEEIRREFASGELSLDQRSGLSSAPSASAAAAMPETPSGSGSPSGLSADRSSDSFSGRAQRAGLPRLLVVFALVSVVVLFLVRFVMLEFGLPNWVLPGAFILLLIGLPVLIATAWIQAGPDVRTSMSGDSAARPASPSGSGDSGSSAATGTSTRRSSPSGLRRWLTWKRAIGGGVLAFAGLAVLIGGYLVSRSQGIGPAASLVSAGMLEDNSRILIADFVNQTDDPLLGQAMKEAFTVDLSQSSVVRLVTPAEISSALGRMELDPKTPLDEARANEIALRDGIPAVVTGQINPAGSGALLSVRLISPESGTPLAAFRENASGPDEMIPAIDRLSNRLREKIGESLKAIRANPPLDQVTTPSLQALQKYTEAVEAIETDRDNDRGVALLEEATAIDTTFAMAYRKLSVALNNTFQARSKINDAAERAFRHRGRLTERERYLTEAWYYDCHNDTERAKQAYREVIELDPEDDWALNNLGRIYLNSGDAKTAEEYFLRIPQSTRSFGNLASAKLRQGNLDAAEQLMDEQLAEDPELDNWFMRMALQVEREDYEGAQKITATRMEEDHDSPTAHRGSLATAIALAYIRGQVQEARRLQAERQELTERSFSGAEYLSSALNNALLENWAFGNETYADSLVASAIRKYPFEELPLADRPYTGLYAYYVMRERSEEAGAVLDSYNTVLPELDLTEPDEALQFANGYQAMVEGNPDAAIAEFRRWGRPGDTQGHHAWMGHVFFAAAQYDSAIVHYEHYLDQFHEYKIFDYRFDLAKTLSAVANCYERTGQPQRAAEYYGKFADLWADGDPAMRQQSDRARKTAKRLLGEES